MYAHAQSVCHVTFDRGSNVQYECTNKPAGQKEVTMAETKSLIEQDDGHISEEEALIYISDEKHPTGSSKKAEIRRYSQGTIESKAARTF